MTYDSGRNTPHQKSFYSPDSPPPEDYQVRLVSRGVSEYHVGRAPLLNRARDVGDTCLLRKIHGFFKQSISLLEKVLTQVGWVHHAGEARHVADGVLTQPRSEEHTSELQSQSNLVCRLLLE